MQGAVGLLAKIVGVAVVTHWSGGSWNVTTLCVPLFVGKGPPFVPLAVLRWVRYGVYVFR